MSDWLLNFLMNHHNLVDIVTRTVAVCSVLHTFLPPYDWRPDFVTTGLAEFPTAQGAFYAVFNNRYYRLLIYVIGFVALNARSTIWRYVSINNLKGPNVSVSVRNGGLPQNPAPQGAQP